MKIIDIITGDFLLIDGVIINKSTTYSELRKLFPDNQYWEVGTGYFWIYFIDVIAEQKKFCVDICFKAEQLDRVLFGFRGVNEKAFTWEDFDEKIELQKKKSYEKWLIKTLGNTQFAWGNVGAFYDPKSCLASMGLFYR